MHKYILLCTMLLTFVMATNNIEFTTQKVIVFKDGYCLVIKEGSATSNDKGEIISYSVPDSAVLGSLWATAQEANITSLNAEWREVISTKNKEFTCTQHIEILQVNKGKKCKVVTHDKVTYEGTIHEVLSNKTRENLPHNMWEVHDEIAEGATSTISGISGSYFVLRTSEQDVLLATSQIRSLSIPNIRPRI